MADNCAICLVGAMDRLWFHQIILFSEPNSLLLCKSTLITPQDISETRSWLSSNNSQSPLLEEEISSSSSPSAISSSEDVCNIQPDDEEKDTKPEKRPTGLNGLTSSKPLSKSPSQLKHVHSKRSRSYSASGSVMRLQKTMSCKSLAELELEEVKGFMDLGFKFSKEHVSPRMVSVVPGLQRLIRCYANTHDEAFRQTGGGHEIDGHDDDHETIYEGYEEEKGVMRPYLSEAWLIKRPDSPLLNFRVPRVSAAAEMKKHLRCWARTVASVIQQES